MKNSLGAILTLGACISLSGCALFSNSPKSSEGSATNSVPTPSSLVRQYFNVEPTKTNFLGSVGYSLEGGKEGSMGTKIGAELLHIRGYTGENISINASPLDENIFYGSKMFWDNYFPGLNSDADNVISWKEFNRWREDNREAIRQNVLPTSKHVGSTLKKKNYDAISEQNLQIVPVSYDSSALE